MSKSSNNNDVGQQDISWSPVEPNSQQTFASYPDGKLGFMKRLTVRGTLIDALSVGEEIQSSETITTSVSTGSGISFFHKAGQFFDGRAESQIFSSGTEVTYFWENEDVLLRTEITKMSSLYIYVEISYNRVSEGFSDYKNLNLLLPILSLRNDEDEVRTTNIFMYHFNT